MYEEVSLKSESSDREEISKEATSKGCHRVLRKKKRRILDKQCGRRGGQVLQLRIRKCEKLKNRSREGQFLGRFEKYEFTCYWFVSLID